MPELDWVFSRVEGGQDSGFHDAGIETFKGDFNRYLAREMIQNSLDARLDHNKPSQIHFDVEEIPVVEIPDSKRLSATIQRCAEAWPRDKSAKAFFERAIKLLGKKTITTLRVSDYNTTGVPGSDSDSEKNWYNLVRCGGSSPKGGGEGGSFGIGKNAPLAASQLRTVLYSTKTIDGEIAFQGIAKMVTHSHPEGGKAQPVGFLGGPKGESVRKESAIPKRFLRTKLGTDIFILGIAPVASWKDDLTFSVLENFWPAIHFKDLQVHVGDLRITSENLGELLEAFSSKDGFSAYQYYRAFTSATKDIHVDLPILGKVDLYLLVGEPDLPKRIVMIRKTGMVIYPRLFRSPLNFSGVFLCRNDRGNAVLRNMEPPRHDYWDPDLPEKSANKKTEAELSFFLRESVRSLTPADDSKSFMIPGLSRFLPDDEETPEQSFDAESKPEKPEESADRLPRTQTLSGKKIDPKRKSLQPDDSQAGAGQDGAGAPGDDGTTGGLDGPPNEKEGADRWHDDAGSKTDPGGPGGGGSKPPIPIFYRTFSRDPLAGIYTAVVTAKKKGGRMALIQINGIGDDGSKNPAAIHRARTAAGDILPVKGNAIGPLPLPGGTPLKIEIVLADPARVSMEVVAHEIE